MMKSWNYDGDPSKVIEYTTKRIALDKIQFDQRSTLHVSILRNIETKHREIGDVIDFAISSFLDGLQEKSTCVLSVQYPDGWFQALKQDYFPGWFIKKWPVKMKTVTKEQGINHYALFPSIQGVKQEVCYVDVFE